MRRRDYLKKNIGRIGLTLLLFCLIVYTVYHAAFGSAGSLQTTPVQRVTDTELVAGEGWLFRDETLLTVPQAGLVHSLAVSGTKVARSTELLQVWYPEGLEGEALEQAQLRLNALDRQIALLQKSLLPEGTKLSAASGYRAEAMQCLSDILADMRAGNWASIPDTEADMLVALNRYGSLLSTEEGVRQALDILTANRDRMLSGSSQTLVNDASSGYYYAKEEIDGLEELFRVEELETLTGARFAELKAASPTESAALSAGKICYGYQWYLALSLPRSLGEQLTPGERYTVRFPENRDRELGLVCTDVREADGDEVIVILRSDVTPAEFSFLRSQTVELTLGERAGLYIPEQALVWQDGELGVYVFDSGAVSFRRISPAVTREGYLLALVEDPEPDKALLYLKQNDLMILSGKNLYDGKVYRQ